MVRQVADLVAGTEWYDHLPVADEQPMGVGEDVARSGVTGVQRGVAGIGGAMGDMARGAHAATQNETMQQIAPNHGTVGDLIALFSRLPSSMDINHAIESVFGQQHQPQTTPGRYAETIGEFAPNALIPGGVAARVARVVAPGVASEFAGEATEGTPIEPLARVAGALGGGVAAEAGINVANVPENMLRTATAGATDADLAAAQALQQRAARQGVRLTRAEALQQVTSGGTGMQDMQDLVETSPHGSPIMAPFMRDRPQETAAAVEGFANRVAPPTPQPSVLGLRTQSAAGNLIDQERQTINARARPNYEALTNEEMPVHDFQALMQDPAFARAMQTVRGNPMLNHGLENLPDTNLSVINRVVQQTRQLGENAIPNPNRESGSNFVASQFARAERDASNTASRASSYHAPGLNQQVIPEESNWDAAHRTVREGREATLEPMQAGPLGRVAETSDPQQQTRALFPAAPPAGGANETEAAMQQLSAADPDAASGIARQHILGGRAGATEQMQQLAGGENQFGMARWASNLAGNPEQQKALLAGFRALPNGGALADELADLIETGHATGRRYPSGSRTAARTELMDQARRVIPEVPKFASQVMLGQRARRLAEFLTEHPDETAAALRAARDRAGASSLQPMLADLLLARPQDHADPAAAH